MSTPHGSTATGEQQQDERRPQQAEGPQQPEQHSREQGQSQHAESGRRQDDRRQDQPPQAHGGQRSEGAVASAPGHDAARQSAAEARPPERGRRQPQPKPEGGEVLPRPMISGDDLALDAPRMSAEELDLELEGSAGVERVNLHAKSLDVEMYLRASLENLAGGIEVRKAGARPAGQSSRQGGQGGEQRGDASPHVLGELERALESARSAYERAAPELREELHEAYDTFRDALQHVVGDGRQDGEGGEQRRGDAALHAVGERARRLVRSPRAAAVAGAVAVLAGSRLHLPSQTQDRGRAARRTMSDRATDIRGGVADRVRRRLG